MISPVPVVPSTQPPITPGVATGGPAYLYVWRDCVACGAEIGFRGTTYWWSHSEVLPEGGRVSCPSCGVVHTVSYDADWDSATGWKDLTALTRAEEARAA